MKYVFVLPFVSLLCVLQGGRPAVQDGWTHVLFQEQVQPLCVSANSAVEKTDALRV